jgi:Fic family protein
MSAVAYHHGGFPPAHIDWPRLISLIGPANAAVARYAGLLEGIPSPDVMISPLLTQEAVLSTRIEGTQATMGEVLELEAQGELFEENTEKKKDIREILNYRAALNEAVRLLDTLPLSQRLLCETHRALMQGVRGRNKAPGEYRRIPHSTQPDILVQLAIIHAELEAIHPFLDGNGRLGRLLVPLYLYARGVIHVPAFYLSAYFEEHRDEYYARLLAVSRDGDWTGWIAFFLAAVIEQASANQRRIQAILSLYHAKKGWISEATRSQFAVKALDWMFQKPIFSASDFRAKAGIPDQSAARILRICRESGMIGTLAMGGGRRSSILWFPELMRIAEGDNAV